MKSTRLRKKKKKKEKAQGGSKTFENKKGGAIVFVYS